MKRLFLILAILLLVLSSWRSYAQQSTFGETVGVASPCIYKLSGVSLNSAATDVGTFTGLPAKYIVRRLTVTNASTSLTLATVSLHTTTGGGGTAIVSIQALSGLTGSGKFVDLTLAVTTDTQTASSLVLRNITAQGSAATADAYLEILPLP